MNSFRNGRLTGYGVPVGTVWLLNDIAEFKGKQDSLAQQNPGLLKTLQDTAIIRSAESSNRTEGVVVDPYRLEPIVLRNSKPRNPSEQEVQGYCRALNQIHSRHAGLAISANTIRGLHKLCQPSNGDAGQFKRVDNDIVQLLPGKAPIVRFQCVPATQTPGAVSKLCDRCLKTVRDEAVPPLISIGALVLDFLCIHPFRDGNGRVSRLLTLLALHHHGYEVGRYISIERLIEESQDEYYESLHRSSGHWHQCRHDPTPWFNFILGIIRRAYAELEDVAGSTTAGRGAKVELILAAIRSYEGEFRVVDLQRDCPSVGRDWIRKILAKLKQSGKVACSGRGPAARWRLLRKEVVTLK